MLAERNEHRGERLHLPLRQARGRLVEQEQIAPAGHETTAFERCPTSWTETWFGGTISHGWSSTPTRDLVQRVLGVTPAEPGFAVAAIEPALGDLEWAAGVVPTGHGSITVRVEEDRIEFDSPVPVVHAGARYEPGSHIVDLTGDDQP